MDLERFDSYFKERLRESTDLSEWKKFLAELRLQLQERLASTPDAELPTLKHQLVFLGELENFFVGIFSKEKKKS